MKTALEGKTAVVTGVTSGIGEAITARLLDAGVSVLGIARDGAKLAALRVRWGDRFSSITVDLASPDEGDRRSPARKPWSRAPTSSSAMPPSASTSRRSLSTSTRSVAS
jgi:nucleoside-diphosphate-sugar epimerase